RLPWTGQLRGARKAVSRARSCNRFVRVPSRTAAGPLPRLGQVAKAAVLYACTECGTSSPGWFGKCRSCGSFGTLVEEAPAPPPSAASARPLLRLVEVDADEAERISTGVPELDRVLGGGLVPASLVL